MPQYDYECQNCDHTWEEIKSVVERHKPLSNPCPNCHKCGYVVKPLSPVTMVDPIVTGAGKMVDPGLKNKLDQMQEKYPGMKREL